jgi:hypothetical protein
MCPIEAFTTNPDPRYFSMVFAFAGLSTITSWKSPFGPLAAVDSARARLAGGRFEVFLAIVLGVVWGRFW